MWRVVISGYYGFENAGDEALLQSMLEAIRAELPGVEPVVLSQDPGATGSRYGVRAVRRDDWRVVLQELRRARLVISGGGSLLQDMTSARSALYYLGIIFAARFMGRPVFFYAQGVGPLSRGYLRLLTRWAVNGAAVVTVRDEDSRAYLERMGIRRPILVTADPVFYSQGTLAAAAAVSGKRPKGSEDRKLPVVGLAVRSWPGMDEEALVRLTDSLLKSGMKVRLLGLHPQNDTPLIQRLVLRLFPEGMPPGLEVLDSPRPPVEWLRACAGVDILVGMRLHALIFAALAGVPVIGVGDDPKLRGFLGQLGDEPVPMAELAQIDPGMISRKLGDTGTIREKERQLAESLGVKARLTAEKAAAYLRGRFRFLGVTIPPWTLGRILQEIGCLIQKGEGGWVVTANPELLVRAHDEPAFLGEILEADLVTADGTGILLAGRLKGSRFPGRVTGIDLVQTLAKEAARTGYRLYLLGGEPGVAEETAGKLRDRYPGLQVSGTRDGYYPVTEEDRVVQEIKVSGAQVVLVGLGSPRQEEWCRRRCRELKAVCVGVGGSFDVLSGRKKRAPRWVRAAGLEWLYRFLREPWRWKRMLSLPRFVWLVLREKGVTDK